MSSSTPKFILSGFVKEIIPTDRNNLRKPIDIKLTNGMSIRVYKEQLDKLPKDLEKQPLLAVCKSAVITRKNTYIAHKLFPLTSIVDDYGKIAQTLESSARAAYSIYEQMSEKERQVWIKSLQAAGYGCISVGSGLLAIAAWTTAAPLAVLMTGTSIISALGASSCTAEAMAHYAELKALMSKHETVMSQYYGLLKIAGLPSKYLTAPNITPRMYRAVTVLSCVLDTQDTEYSEFMSVNPSDLTWAYA